MEATETDRDLQAELQQLVDESSYSAWEIARNLDRDRKWLVRKLDGDTAVETSDLYAVRYYLEHIANDN